jgi:hypothetical protein
VTQATNDGELSVFGVSEPSALRLLAVLEARDANQAVSRAPCVVDALGLEVDAVTVVPLGAAVENVPFFLDAFFAIRAQEFNGGCRSVRPPLH